MAWLGNKVLAVIPARGGSKGIPRKNLQAIEGISLVGRVGNFAQQLTWLDAAVLTTEDSEIAIEGKRFGLEVPFVRPSDLASDEASSIAVWRHAWLETEKAHRCCYDISILLEPTSPLRRTQDIERTVNTLVEAGSNCAITVSRSPGHYTPEKCLMITESGHLTFYSSEGPKHSRRQTIPPYYHRNGVCYAVRRHAIMTTETLFDCCSAIVIDRPLANIDEPIDLAWAEFILARGDN